MSASPSASFAKKEAPVALVAGVNEEVTVLMELDVDEYG
jgi:hypothetical protein